MKDPLVRQRSQAPPLTVAVTRASQTVTWDQRPKRVTGRHRLHRCSPESELSCLSAVLERLKHGDNDLKESQRFPRMPHTAVKIQRCILNVTSLACTPGHLLALYSKESGCFPFQNNKTSIGSRCL